MRGVLAFDLGASSGRGVFTTLHDGAIKLKEVNRFSDYTIKQKNSLRWDIKYIFKEIDQGIKRANAIGDIESVAVNTWGVDFGLIDKDYNLIENPYHYRDLRTREYPEKIKNTITPMELYERTGVPNLKINTLYQLLALKETRPEIYKKIHKILLMPDLINFYLTGEIFSERSIASTTQLYSPLLKDWDYELIERVGLKSSIFPEIIDSGEKIGTLKKDIAKRLKTPQIPVVSVASHDTASATSCTPSDKKGNLFLSSGTWSLVGTTLDQPILSEKAFSNSMTNETGLNEKITFLKNITGLWLLEETKKQFEKEGKYYTFTELSQLASKTNSIDCYFDTELLELTIPGNIPKRIQIFAKKSGQNIPETDGQIVRTIYENLALKYRTAYEGIVQSVGYSFNNIYIVGGGSKAEFLSRCTANALNLNAYVGLDEATVLGNSLVQMETLEMFTSTSEKNDIISKTFDLKQFIPTDTIIWDEKYKKYKEVVQSS